MTNLKCIGHDEGSERYGESVTNALHHHMCAPNILDRLVVLFDALSQMVTTSTNARAEESVGADDNSVMGFYLRRCWCDFTALPFEGVCRLAHACERYAAPMALMPSSVDQPSHGKETEEEKCPEQETITNLRPRLRVERFLSGYNSRVISNVGTISSEELLVPLKELDERTPGLPLSYLNQASIAVFERDVISMKENLHRHGDAGSDPYVQSIGIVSSGDVAQIPPRVPRAAAAPLTLAAMHARLGQVKGGMNTLDEAMRTFQQSSDDASLVHALAVLCQLLEIATPGSVDLQGEVDEGDNLAQAHAKELRELLTRCLERAEETKLPHIMAYARLSLARHSVASPSAHVGDDSVAFGSQFIPPCKAAVEVCNASRYVSHLDLAAKLTAAVPVPPPSTGGLACLRIVKGLTDTFSSPCSTFGPALMGAQSSSSAEVSRLAGSVPLLKAAKESTFTGNRRLSMTHLSGYLSNYLSSAGVQDKACAISHAAILIADSYGFLASERVLGLASRYFCHGPEPTPLRAAKLTIAHRRALHRRDIRYSLELASRLVGIVPLSATTGSPLRIEGEEAIVMSLLAGGYFAEAERGAQKVFRMAQEAYLPLVSLRILLLLGRIHLEAGALDVAIRYLRSTIEVSDNAHADMISAEATTMLAVARRRLDKGYLQTAICEVSAVLPLILAHGTLDLRSRTRLLYSELLLEAEKTKENVAVIAGTVLPLLKSAARDAEKLEDWERVSKCWHLMALVSDAAGSVKGRDAACKRFLRLTEQLRAREGLKR